MVRKKKTKSKAKKPVEELEPMEEEGALKPSVWLPGQDMGEDEALQYDPTAYLCMSSLSLEWPSLSFDIVKDTLGDNRSDFPMTMFFVGGTQAASSKLNYIAVAKVSNITQGKHGQRPEDEEEDSDDDMKSDDEDDEETAHLAVRKVAHTGGINRIRSMRQQPHIIASWADTSQVQILDLGPLLNEVAAEDVETSKKAAGSGKIQKVNARQVHSHSSEGYALDWSPVAEGRLASGDCRSRLHVWTPAPGGRWQVSAAYKGHEASVEDIQWSPTEETVLASCSVDKTIKIWDTREPSKPMLSVEAHSSDVNVISWNGSTAYMLASGGDDGALKIWDLRQFNAQSSAPVANFNYHRAPITSVEWCPHEASSLATSSSDNQIAIWDLALERDPEEEAALAPEANAEAPQDLPPQLLFVHAGQKEPKEVHWHPQIPGLLMSTAEDGYNIWKPSNI